MLPICEKFRAPPSSSSVFSILEQSAKTLRKTPESRVPTQKRPKQFEDTPSPFSELRSDSLPDEEEIILSDPYESLKYNECQIDLDLLQTQTPDWKEKTVLVKKSVKCSPSLSPEKQGRRLSLALSHEVEQLQVYSDSTSMCRKTAEYLQRQCSRPPLLRNRVLVKQEKALKDWAQHKDLIRRQGVSLSQKLARSPRNLVLNKSTTLPPIQNHRAQFSGQDFPQPAQSERFYQGDAFFLLTERIGADRKLVRTPTWTERKLYKPPVSIVQEESDTSINLPTLDAWKGQLLQPLKQLHLHGRAVPDTQVRRSGTGDSTYACLPRISGGAAAEEARKESHWPHQPAESVPTTPSGKLAELRQYTKPCLQVAGRVYAWNEPCDEDIVEVGSIVEAGLLAKTTLELVNLGCTVIRYSWLKEPPPRDVFNLGHYKRPTIFFDPSDGVLLPRGTAKLTVQFTTKFAGVWCEHWNLWTTPHLGPAGRGRIRINFWGMALQVDYNFLARQLLDAELEKLVTQRKISNLVHELVMSLPIHVKTELGGEDADRMVEQALLPDDIRLFQMRNPGLHYHSYAMFVLFKIQTRWNRTVRLADVSVLKKRKGSLKKLDSPRRNLPPRKDSWKAMSSLKEFQMRRADIRMKPMLREICLRKETDRDALLQKFNMATELMSKSPLRPLQDCMYIICRMALVRAMDDIDEAALRIRRHLAERPKHAPRNPNIPTIQLSTNVDMKTQRGVRRVDGTEAKVLKYTVQEESGRAEENSGLFQVPQAYVSSQKARERQASLLQQFRSKLQAFARDRLAEMVSSIFPLLEHERPVQLNPLHRPQPLCRLPGHDGKMGHCVPGDTRNRVPENRP